jgi:ribosome assembly protein RRB1
VQTPFSGHTDSVEDVQWSPTESTVFMSCSVDRTVRVWDTRQHARSALHVAAHDADVNVISWNRLVPYLVISGGDDGHFKIWDLRSFAQGQPAATFKWHTKAITSVQWSPHEDSVLAVSGEDNQVRNSAKRVHLGLTLHGAGVALGLVSGGRR